MAIKNLKFSIRNTYGFQGRQGFALTVTGELANGKRATLKQRISDRGQPITYFSGNESVTISRAEYDRLIAVACEGCTPDILRHFGVKR